MANTRELLAEERKKRLTQATDARDAEVAEPAVKSGAGEFHGRVRLNSACEISIDRIIPDPDQPRSEFDPEALDQLASSIKARGILQPIRVRWDVTADRYIVVVGERRWRASQAAGLLSIPCVVMSGDATAEEILEDQIVENCLRVDLNAIEQATAFRTLMTRQNLSQTALAAKLNISQSQVQKVLSLLTLPEPIKDQVRDGAIGPSVAYQISRIDDPDQQAEMAEKAALGQVRRDEIVDRARKPSTERQTRAGRVGRPKPWLHEVAGVARVRLEALADDVDPFAMYEAMKAAAAAYKRTLPKNAGRQEAA